MGWRPFLSRAARDRERAEEFEVHLNLQIDEFVARGLTRDEATRRARLQFGNPRARREEMDDLHRLPIVEALGRDIRYALRILRRSPAFTLTALATLTLVIGANTAVFSLADALLVRPLPYPHAEQLSAVVTDVRSSRGQGRQEFQDGASWEALVAHTSMLDLAAIAGSTSRVNLVAGGTPAVVSQSRVSAGFFRMLGVTPSVGRAFAPEEDRPGGPAVAVLSFALCQRLFHGETNAIGQSVLLRGEPYEVVGAMPRGFRHPGESTDVWTPARPARTGEGGGANYQVLARLRSGYTWAQADGQLASLGTAFFKARGLRPGTTRSWSMRPLQQTVVENVSLPITLLVAAVGMVLVIACVNLAALFLARGGSRRKEIATRMALGGGRGAVVRQLMVESLVLGVAGGTLGVWVGALLLAGLKVLAHDTFREWQYVTLDARALAATAGLALLTSVVVGLAPALQASRVDVQAALRDAGSRSTPGRSRHWLRRTLVASQVALGVVLLVVTGLLIRTFVNLRSLTPGFDSAHVTTVSVSLDDARYRTSERVNLLFDRSVQTLKATPGIDSAAISLELPYRRLLNNGFAFADAPRVAEDSMADFTYVTPDFFSALRIPLRSGRVFTDGDLRSTPAVVVVNDTFVRTWAKGSNPIGRRIKSDAVEYTIVGVVGDVQVVNSGIPFPGQSNGPLITSPVVFLAAAQVSDSDFRTVHAWFAPVWSVRAAAWVNVGQAIQRAINDVDPLLPVGPALSMAAVEAEATATQRLLVTLVGVLAFTAVFLSAIGLYGMIALSVAERRREFGIRLALGATPRQMIRRMATSGIALAAVGATGGLGLAWICVRVLESVLWGVAAHDEVTFLAVPILLLLVASVSSVLPALRILRLDPAMTLRD